jgi:hypothetical protein
VVIVVVVAAVAVVGCLFQVTQPGPSNHGYLIPYFSQAHVGKSLNG